MKRLADVTYALLFGFLIVAFATALGFLLSTLLRLALEVLL